MAEGSRTRFELEVPIWLRRTVLGLAERERKSPDAIVTEALQVAGDLGRVRDRPAGLSAEDELRVPLWVELDAPVAQDLAAWVRTTGAPEGELVERALADRARGAAVGRATGLRDQRLHRELVQYAVLAGALAFVVGWLTMEVQAGIIRVVHALISRGG
jgi:hypothetical protein